MPLDVRPKLLLAAAALVLASGVAADVVLTSVVAEQVRETTRGDMLGLARLVAREAEGPAAPASPEGWHALSEATARTAGVWVSLVREDGVVLGDSEIPPPLLEHADNLARRAEIEGALATGTASVDRPRSAGREATSYAAVRFRTPAGQVGVARVAGSLRGVDAAVARVRRVLWTGAALTLAIALGLFGLIARRTSGAIGALTDAARRMAGGDLSVRTRPEGDDELSRLGSALDGVGASLATTLEQLRGDRDLQRRILEAMQEGVAVVDREGHVLLVNPALRAMLLLGADAVGKLLIEAVRHAELDELLEETRRGEEAAPTEIELPGLKPRRLLVHASPLAGDDERLLVVFVDVTELRRLESLRRDFVANASHELRTPIAAVSSATETLRSGALEDPGAAGRFVDIIERNALRLQSLVEDMLDLSKLESREFRLKRERVELGSVVPLVLALFRERAEKKRVALAAEPALAGLDVEGDARGVEHVLSNLVDNAIKYCPPGSRITVRAAAEGERVRLVVADTGPGIPAEHLPRLFERFYRVDAGRSRELGGTGLGLSIVKHMVEAMKGKVGVESQPGQGSTFTVWLPAARAPAAESHEEFTGSGPGRHGGEGPSMT